MQDSSQYVLLFAHTSNDVAWGPVTKGLGVGTSHVTCCGGSSVVVHSTDNVLDTNEWSHVSAVYDVSASSSVKGRWRLYVDGQDVTDVDDLYISDASPGEFWLDITPVHVWLADNQTYADEEYTGSMDDVRIYNRALSAAEVKRLYELGR